MTTFRVLGRSFYLLSTSLFLLTGVSADNTLTDGQTAWLQSIHDSWSKEDYRYKNSPTSPLAGKSRFEISETNTVYFAEKDSDLGWSLEQSDQPVFSLMRSGAKWMWTGQRTDISLTREDEEIPSGSFLASGDQLKAGQFTVELYPSEAKITVLVFDPNTQRRKEFKTLDRFDANPKFAVTAKIARFESPEQLELITARQQFKKQYRYAKLQFEIDGMKLELTAYKHALEGEGSNVLFIPFTDKTSGKYTYGGGRYLIVEEPQEGDEVLIDFNLVTNPLCCYAEIYNCIVPTRENKLPIAILAGVKKYH